MNLTISFPSVMYFAFTKHCWMSFQRTTSFPVLGSRKTGIVTIFDDESARNDCESVPLILSVDMDQGVE